MKLNARMIATAAFAAFLIPAFNLFAGEAAKPLAGGAKEDKAASSSVAVAADPAAPLPAAPMPSGSMGPARPYSGVRYGHTPRIEWFMGYTYLRAVPELAAGNRLVHLNGGSTSVAFNFNRFLGIVGDFGGFNDTRLLLTFPGGAPSEDRYVNQGSAFTYLAGPRFSYRKFDRVTPFAQALFGGIHASDIAITGCTVNCTFLPSENAFALTAGGGLDIKISHHIALRVVQAEYLMTRFENRNTASNSIQNDIRLSSGLVFRFGGNSARAPELPPLAYSCSANPSAVFQGEPIAVSGTAVNLNPEKTAAYTWSADGGTVIGDSSTGKIDTTTVAPGSYTLKGHVSEGDRPGENADCSAPYMVKALEPPSVSCLATPSAVNSGDSSTITATGISPQNRPLTYSYSATSGTVSGSGTTATLATAGAAGGTITVTCNVADDKGQTASSTAMVTVNAPSPGTSELCPISFARDVRRPSRVDNEAKACLDQVALSLQSNSDAKLALIGNAASNERDGSTLAAQRATNARVYLVSEKGIDAARIAVYTGSQDGKTVSTIMIPAGATFDPKDAAPVQ